MHQSEEERLTSERVRLEAEHAAIVQVTNDHDAAAIRAAREAAWADHRRKLDAASADLFEAALRRDDLVMEARLNLQAHVAKLQEFSRSLWHVPKRMPNRAATATRRPRRNCCALMMKSPPPSHHCFRFNRTLDQFEAWLEKRDKALETEEHLQQSRRDLREAEADATDARQRLISTLGAAGMPHDPDASTDALRAMAQAVLDSETRVKGLRTGVERCQLQREDCANEIMRAAVAERSGMARGMADRLRGLLVG